MGSRPGTASSAHSGAEALRNASLRPFFELVSLGDGDAREAAAVVSALVKAIQRVRKLLESPAFQPSRAGQQARQLASRVANTLQSIVARIHSLSLFQDPPSRRLAYILMQLAKHVVELHHLLAAMAASSPVRLVLPWSSNNLRMVEELLERIGSLDLAFQRELDDLQRIYNRERHVEMQRDLKRNLYEWDVHNRLNRVLANSENVYENRKTHDENMDGLVPGFGESFLSSLEYTSWLSSPGTTLLAPGIPGSGKSTMTSVVLDHVRRTQGRDAKFAWFFFDQQWRDPSEPRHSLTGVIAALTLLLLAEHDAAGHEIPMSPVQLVGDKLESGAELATADLAQVMRDLGVPANRVFLLFDAIDGAVSDEIRTILMPQLQDLQASMGLNIFVTASLSTDMEELFPHSISREIRISPEDMSSYLHHNLNSDRRLSRVVGGTDNRDLREQIVTTTVDLSDGMFFFTRRTIQHLAKLPSRRAMLSALKDASRVDPLYERLVARLRTEPDTWRLMLPWATFAKRPMRPSELRHALAAADEQTDFKGDTLVDVESVSSSSCGLFVIRLPDPRTSVFQFCHWTAADFFKRSEPAAGREWPLRIASACLHYLSLPHSTSGARDLEEQYQKRIASYPFFEYAASHWAAHLKDVDDPAASFALQEKALRFLSNPESVASSAYAVLRTASDSQDQAVDDLIALLPAPSDMDALSLVAYLGVPTLAKSLLSTQDNDHRALSLSRTDSLGRTALFWAACGGSVSAVRLLIESECEINRLDKAGHNALVLAVSLGHADIARLLLEAGADLGGSAQPPLSMAVETGHADIVQMLLDHGADYRRLLDNGDTVLHRAARRGHTEVVQVLRIPFSESEWSMDPLNFDGQTPLWVAASLAHADVVEILLAAGANTSVVDIKHGQTPLQQAMLNQHWPVLRALLASQSDLGQFDPESLLEQAIESEGWECIDLLLHRGDAGLPSSTPGRLLCQAARKGKASVVRRLVESYPDSPDTLDADNKLTPLAWAAREGHTEVIEILLDHGRDVNSKDGENKTPLERAIEGRQDDAAMVLLDVEGVNTSIRDSDSATLLALAAKEGMVRTVQQLLQLEAIDPNSIDNAGHTALSLAAEHGQAETVRALLESGRASLLPEGAENVKNPLFSAVRADQSEVVSVLAQRDGIGELIGDAATGRTALSVACARGHLETVQALLTAKNALITNLADRDGKTPLCWAAQRGHAAVVDHLLNIKANVNAKTQSGWTPLHFAAQAGSTSVIRILLPHADPNAVADDCTTPLVAALQAGDQGEAAVRLLLPFDYVSLHQQVQRGDEGLVQHLLEAGYNINMKDHWGRTPLHALVTSDNEDRIRMATLLLASSPKPDLTIEDTEGLTPVRLALRESRMPLVKLFLRSGAGLTREITAEDWLQAFGAAGRAVSNIIKVQERPGEGTEVACLVKEAFSEMVRTSPDSTLSGVRRLFIFTEPQPVLPVVLQYPFPRANSLPSYRQPMWLFLHRPATGSSIDFTIALYFPVLAELLATSSSPPTGHPGRVLMIRWTVAKTAIAGFDGGGDRTVSSWQTATHFSTLPNGWIPDGGVDFFKQFLAELQTRWLHLCQQGEELLSASRKRVLRKGGKDPDLIQRLLTDAGLWIDLQGHLKQQVDTAVEFASEYNGFDSDEMTLAELPGLIREFNNVVNDKLERLNAKSQELIQTEFNLTSIAEAKHSTSTNNSMKRLTWITFIFLPLTFISSLFGMNVDVLDPPPPWWWYAPVAVGTMFLTVSVWIVFKRNETLEERLERKFAWLVKAKSMKVD
ncbi:ankyrin repeat-containing domain protein [Staphylotrichum tortipilum]|uniref:Ankyrin repeat-containing domain protein n=1 Tax=Staphylotrichum tortipilum TaxID=2831512 RepID=A0AAN6MI49_9PEZI|nr:ankyrin repeat-containing domain protein [Staphylotrichum longicolle]